MALRTTLFYAAPPPTPAKPPTPPKVSKTTHRPYRPHLAPIKAAHLHLHKILIGTKSTNPPTTPSHSARTRSKTAITRLTVIFADFLADLCALDILSDITESPLPISAALAALSALPAALLLADLLSAVAHWASATYFPPAAFRFIPTPHHPPPVQTPSLVQQELDVEKEALSSFSLLHVAFLRAVQDTAALDAHLTSTSSEAAQMQMERSGMAPQQEKDVFELLANSCALLTPFLALLTGWCSESDGVSTVFVETLFLFTLSLASLVPLVRNAAFQVAPVRVLHGLGLVKERSGGEGWCELSGFWDRGLKTSGFFENAEVMLESVGVKKRNGARDYNGEMRKGDRRRVSVEYSEGFGQRVMLVLSSFLCSMFISK